MMGYTRTRRRIQEFRLKLLSENGRCKWCGQIVSPEESSIDHIVPKSKGGTNRRDNLALAHKRCNQLKSDLMPQEFVAAQEKGSIVIYQ